MNKIVFVNNPAASSGGALTILKQFIEQVAQKNKQISFFIFCSSNDLIKYENQNIKMIVLNSSKNWFFRIYWDFYGLKRWSKKNGIIPSLILSLQNTGVYNFKGIKQVVYLHQSLPYYKEYKWKLSKKEERPYWFYRNIYKYLIHLSLTKETKIVVQSEWLKKRVSDLHNIKENNIYIIKPYVEANENRFINNNLNSFVFFPASGQFYKNHQVLIKAASIIKQYYGIKLIFMFTLSLESQYAIALQHLAKQVGVDDQIAFVGNLPHEEVMKYYEDCSLVAFPSYIETFGLPLVEAASLLKPIVASDLEYAREALEGYNGVTFVDHNDSQKWAESIFGMLKIQEVFSFNRKFNSNHSWLGIIME